MKSLVVCVEFDDFLRITLPRNKRHFTRTLVITSIADTATQQIALTSGCELFVTDAFYEQGTHFNKGLAIERALNVLGRDGWICAWDADIVMPPSIQFYKNPAKLYTALRRTLADPHDFSDQLDWNTIPITGLENEYPGYFQLFQANAAGPPPWYTTDWKHAGGYDSDFQAKFSPHNLAHPPFNVLHLGPTVDQDLGSRVGPNWCGRTSPRIDNLPLPENRKAQVALEQIIKNRQVRGTTEGERLAH